MLPVGFLEICLGLFSRALTGELASDEDTWLNFVVYISRQRTPS